jgi:hypothetical protein
MDKSKDAIFVNIHVAHGGEAQVTHGPPGSGRHDHAPHAAHHAAHHATHTWKVAYKGKLYAVSATAGAMTIRLDGEPVWRGECGPHRTYRAHWSKLEPAVETKVLDLARSGDRHSHDDRAEAPPESGPRPSARHDATPKSARHGAAPKGARHGAAPKSARRDAAPKSAPKAEPPAREAAPKKAAAKKTAPKKAVAKKTAPKKAVAKKTAEKKGTVEVAAHSRSAPGSKPPSKQTPAKKTAAKRAAPKKPAATTEPPTTQRSVRPVDDEKVMTELLKGLEKDAPEAAASAYAMLRRAWFNGAREAVLVWMKANPVEKSLAKAYAQWAGANAAQVRALGAEAA